MINHTIIIPTYNRPSELKALLAYYQSQSDQISIIVADSSADSNVRTKNAQTVSEFPCVRYLDFDPSTPLIEKVLSALDQTETPYVSLCADDDLVFPTGIKAAIDVLEREPATVCAHGYYLNFRRSPHAPDALESHVEYQFLNTNSELPAARIMQVALHFEPVFYATFRKNDLGKVFAPCRSIRTLHYQELFQTFAAVMLGETRRLPIPYGGRHSGPAAQPERTDWQTFDFFCSNPAGFLKDYADYKELLIAFYDGNASQSHPIGRKHLTRLFDMAHTTFFTHHATAQHFFNVTSDLYPKVPFQDYTKNGLVSELARKMRGSLSMPQSRQESLQTESLERSKEFLDATLEARIIANFQMAESKIVSNAKTIKKLRLCDDLKGAISDQNLGNAINELVRYCDIRDAGFAGS